MTLNIFVIIATSIVGFTGLVFAVWTFYGTRNLKPVPNKPTPAPSKPGKIGIVCLDLERSCSSCMYGDIWQKGKVFSFGPVLCGAGYKHRYVVMVSKIIEMNQYVNWNIVDENFNQVECEMYLKRESL